MYKTFEVEDKIRVAPDKFNLETTEAVRASLESKWEGIVDKKLGVILAVLSVDTVGEGRIFPGDGALYYPASFKLLAYQPDVGEVVMGEVIDITEFGAFVRFGPVDGMVHVSQIMGDFVSYDSKGSVLTGRDSKRKLKEGDSMVARIVSVSMEKDQFKIGLTARQAGLGIPEWIAEDKKRSKRIGDKEKAEEKVPAKKDAKKTGSKKK